MDDVWIDVASISGSEVSDNDERAIRIDINNVNRDKNTHAVSNNFTSIVEVILFIIVLTYICCLCGFNAHSDTVSSLYHQDRAILSNFIDRFSKDRPTDYKNETISYLGKNKSNKNSSNIRTSVNIEGLWHSVEVIETVTIDTTAMNKVFVDIPVNRQAVDLYYNNTSNSVVSNDINSTADDSAYLTPHYTNIILEFCNASSIYITYNKGYIDDTLSDPIGNYHQQQLPYSDITKVTEYIRQSYNVASQLIANNSEVIVVIILVVALYGYFSTRSNGIGSVTDLIDDDGEFIIARRKPINYQDTPATTTNKTYNKANSDGSGYYSGVDVYTYYIGSSYPEDVPISHIKNTNATANEFTMKLRSKNK